MLWVGIASFTTGNQMKRFLAFLFLSLVACAALAQATTVPVSAQLTWTAVTTGTSGGTTVPITGVTYNVYAGVQPSSGGCTFAGLTQVATGVTAVTDTITQNLAPGSTECYAVTASAGGVTGSPSNIVTAAIPNVTPGTTTVTVVVTIT